MFIEYQNKSSLT